MSLASSDKDTLERLFITNGITTAINNENNIAILTHNVFDAIDSISFKK